MKNHVLLEALRHELILAEQCRIQKELNKSFFHLERIHILGQKSVYWHTLSHLLMLRLAIESRDYSEILGQIIRIPLGLVGSAIGFVPIGNNGRSAVGMFKSMNIPEELRKYLE